MRTWVWGVDSSQGPRESFDPHAIPDPSVVGNLEAEHGQGIFLMRWLMDEVPFEFGCWGTEVHMRKKWKGVQRDSEI